MVKWLAHWSSTEEILGLLLSNSVNSSKIYCAKPRMDILCQNSVRTSNFVLSENVFLFTNIVAQDGINSYLIQIILSVSLFSGIQVLQMFSF